MPSSVQGTTNIWPYYAKGNTSQAKEKGNEGLGKDDFLRLLVAQLKYQDPLQPLQDREFIAQMAQFSSVEQLMNVAEEMRMLRQSMGISADLIGKYVSWTAFDEHGFNEITRSGIVEAISFKEGKQYVVVDGELISLDKITSVWSESINSPPDSDDSTAGNEGDTDE